MKHERSKKRVKELGEVFTPPKVCNEMLDMLDQDQFGDLNYIHFEPCCGTGNFIVEIYKRKLKHFEKELAKTQAAATTVNTTVGIDISEKNIFESRQRALEVILDYLSKNEIQISGSYVAHLIAGIEHQIQVNEMITALCETKDKAERESKKTINSKKWFEENGHKRLDFKNDWVNQMRTASYFIVYNVYNELVRRMLSGEKNPADSLYFCFEPVKKHSNIINL